MSKFKGELTLESGMKMVLDFNALATFEELSGKQAFAFLASYEMGVASITDLRSMYFATLTRHQPNITIDEAGDVFSDYPNAFVDLLTIASPKVEPETAASKRSTVKKK